MVHHRGFAKNTSQLTMLFALSNLWMVRKQIWKLQAWVRLQPGRCLRNQVETVA